MPGSLHSPAFLLWFFYLLLVCIFSTSTQAVIHSNETDRLALLAMKYMFDDPLGVTNSWNHSIPLCHWIGVSCSHRHQRVLALDLRNQRIGGKLSPFIGNLSFLKTIRLDDNSFYGSIPNEVSSLFNLKSLELANNSFSGIIPKNLSSNLITFIVQKNNLHGEIPTEIDSLIKLEILRMGENHLTGQLPTSMGNLSALQVLSVYINNLTGPVPNSLGQLKSLRTFSLAFNNLSGIIHSSIFNISSLVYLNVGLNRFHGTLPSNIGNNLPNLKFLSLFQNSLSGQLPLSLSNASHLQEILLSENSFNGKVLVNFSHFKNLSLLDLGSNNLGTGTPKDLDFLTSLTNCRNLDQLIIYENQFGGMIPKVIGNFSKRITQLVLGVNHIYGSIPSSIGNLVNLEALVLSENQLSGTIPPSITAIKRLQYLHLDQNRLQGTIPTFLGNLTLLVELSLSSNELQGTVPLSLGDCQHMNLLYVDDNSLTGVVPQQIVDITTLVYIDLSNNHLNGAFPSELGNLKTLSELYISSNNFSGMIPSTIGSCTSLEMLYMSHNSLSGRIPSTLSNLKSIRELDLSLNNFSGRIPKYLESLNLLVRLNLSFNNFDGDVPTKGIFNNRTGISLTGNRKLCGGPTEMHLPPCPARNLKKSKISFLKVIIPVIASCSIFSFVIIIITLTRRRFVRNRSTLSPTEEQFPMVTYAELRSATDNFSSSNKIGQGSFGHVYKGVLGEIRKLVAVKVIDLRQRKGLKSFIAECEALRHIRHRNLIKIVTICSSVDAKGDEFKALIYEYMENGNLEEWLHQDHKDGLETRNLSFIERLNIAIDVASALEYLHHHCDPPIVHGDLKATNVLLDCDMVANVGDFGLSKFLSKGTLHPTHQAESSSLGIRGTIGYVAPGNYYIQCFYNRI